MRVQRPAESVGAAGGIVWSPAAYGDSGRALPRRRQRQNPRSWAPRNRMVEASGWWANRLSLSQRTAWAAAAPTGLSGWNLFLAVQSARRAAGLPFLAELESGGSLAPLAAPLSIARPAPQKLRIEWDSDARADAAVVAWIMSPPLDPWETYFRRRNRLVGWSALPAAAAPYQGTDDFDPAWFLVTGKLLILRGLLVDADNRLLELLGAAFTIPPP